MIKTRYLLFLFSLLISRSALAQEYKPNWESLNQRKIPAWFNQSKFGIFIHWGVYAVPSYAPGPPDAYSEWYWNYLTNKNGKSYDKVQEFHKKNYGADFNYMDFAPQFRAELFDPAHWAGVFKKSGARYVVLTSKHHEGFTLWPSAEADRSWGRPWNAVAIGPKRDVLGDLSQSVREAGLKMGFYYSLYEWYNPLWLQKDKSRFINEHLFPQFQNLVTKYKPSLIFSDGEWEMTSAEWRSPELLAWLFNESPVKGEVVVNDRWGKETREHNKATYFTSEYGSGMNADVIWEENRGIGESFGYNRMETVKDYKRGEDLILILTDIVSRGGNLLLDIGPTADGRIPDLMEERLLQIGQWLDTNGEAIYETTAWKKTRQWSKGTVPTIKAGGYQTSYNVSELVKPQKDGKANIEAFFTRKGNNLYCIVPHYVPQLTLEDVPLTARSQVKLLGSEKKVKWRKEGNKVVVDLADLTPSDLSTPTFVLKFSALLE